MKNVDSGFDGFKIGSAVQLWWYVDTKCFQNQRQIRIINIVEAIRQGDGSVVWLNRTDRTREPSPRLLHQLI